MRKRLNHSPYLFLAAVFLLSVAGTISCRKTALPLLRPNIILISFDTLRADRLSCYGYHHQTPAFDALARDGFLFRNASTQFPETRQSHMTIMTSVHPSVHGLTQKRGEWENNQMNPKLQPLAEILKKEDYSTIGITEGCFVAGAMGFSRGFDEYYDQRLGAEKIFAQAGDWLRKNREKRFFLFLHTYETHVPYDPPAEFLPLPAAEYSWEEKMVGSWEYSDRMKKGELKLDPESPEFLKKLNQLYDGEVLFVDRELGGLIETLKKLRLYDDCLLIVLSDHGESLGEKGEFSHGHPGRNNIHVPLIIKPPRTGAKKETGEITGPVGLIDILPTILNLLDLKSHAQPLQGRDLRSGRGGRERFIYSEYPGGAIARNQRWKLIQPQEGKERFYDLKRDPEEKVNLLAGDLPSGEKEVYRTLLNFIARTQSQNRFLRKEFGPVNKPSSTRLEKKALQSLGYL